MLTRRFASDTANDRGPSLKIGAWIMLVFMILVSLTKIATKVSLIGRCQLDDYFIIAAAVLAIIETIVFSFQVDAGLGRHNKSSFDEERFNQTALISEILYVSVICLGRLVVYKFCLLISSSAIKRKIVKAGLTFDCVATVISIFCIAFQCSLPNTWVISGAACFDRLTFWAVYGGYNILIDMFIWLIPFYLLNDVQTTREKLRPLFIALFFRVLTFPLIILRIVFLRDALRSSDYAYDAFNLSLTTQIHLGFSAMVSCVVFLKPIVDNLQSGILSGDLRTTLRSQSFSYQESNDKASYVMGSIQDVTEAERNAANAVAQVRGRPFDSIKTALATRSRSHHKVASDQSSVPFVINQTTTIDVESKTGV